MLGVFEEKQGGSGWSQREKKGHEVEQLVRCVGKERLPSKVG